MNIGGTLISFGILSDTDTFTINPSYFTRREITIIGSMQGRYSMKEAIEAIQRFVERGDISLENAERLKIVKSYEFDDYEEAIEDIHHGNVCKALINIDNVSSFINSKL